VTCSRCGAPVPADAGFCRNCGAILRGLSAKATLVPSSPPPDVSSPTGVREPPAAPPGGGRQRAQPVMPASTGPAAPLTGPPTNWAAGSAQTGRYPAGVDDRMRRHMLAFDYGIIAAGGIVLFSITASWYEKRTFVNGVPLTVTRHLLAGNAGIQRPLVPIVAGLMIIEVVLNMVRMRGRREAWRRHRAVVLLLCVVELVLVVSCMLSSPLSADSLANIGISINTGPGGWIALCGAAIGLLAALGRAFTGSTALGGQPRR
jgi:ribosomal protein L40E